MMSLKGISIFHLLGLLPLSALAELGVPALQEISRDDIQDANHFGHRIAARGNMVLIGSIQGDDGGRDAGKAYLYDLEATTFIAKFTPPGASGQTSFGASLGLSASHVLMGAPMEGGDYSGAAYLFAKPTSSSPGGMFVKKLLAPDRREDSVFGVSVAIGAIHAVVGASQDSEKKPASGAAYIFDAATGDFVRKVVAPDLAENDLFGFAVAEGFGGSTFVSALAKDEYTGAVYMYDEAGVFVRKFLAPHPSPGQYFGHSIAVSGDRLLVGAPYDSSSCTAAQLSCGAAYLFDLRSGELQITLAAAKPTGASLFGNTVALSSSTIAISEQKDEARLQSGSVHLFNMEGVLLADKITSPFSSLVTVDGFAQHLAVAENQVLIGAPDGAGKVYRLSLSDKAREKTPARDTSETAATKSRHGEL